jgi:glycosyltransferase involved in cell wall biosynthesis
MSKRVLIITYYWPPSGGSGVQRWLKFAKYLPETGWEPVIFTPENPDFDLKDESLLSQIPKSLEVLKFPIWEPYQLLNQIRGKKETHPGRLLEQNEKSLLERAAIWARANLLVPDPRIFWVKPSVKFLSDLVEKGQFDAVITTGPPHSMHLIGLELKRRFGIRWIADFRDPWSGWEFLDLLPMTARIRKKHLALEKSVLSEADEVITISPTFQKDLSKLGNRPIQLLTNGFDSEDLPLTFKRQTKKKGELHLVYTGIIDSIRNPIPLLKAMKEEFQTTSDHVKMTFVGRVSDSVKAFVQEDSWLTKTVDFPGYVSHAEVFEFYEKADAIVLILTDTKNAQGNIPGKVFEYLATGIPILALGDPNGDTAKILNEAGATKVIFHTAHTQIQVALRKLVDLEESNQSNNSIDRFTRKNLSIQLAQILDGNPIP